MSTSGDPEPNSKRRSPFALPMTPQERREITKFVRDPQRVKKSARAFVSMVESGALDDVR